VKVYTAAAGALSLSLTDNDSTDITIGNLSNGKYLLSANLAGSVTPATAGWLAATGDNVSANSVIVGTIAQSTLKNGSSTISSGTTVNPAATTQTINISAGLFSSARTVVIGAASDGPQADNFSLSIGNVSSSSMAVGTKSNGEYPITASLSIPGTLSASTNGWFSTGTATGTKSSVTIGSLPEAEFTASGNSYVCTTAGYVPLNFSTGSSGSLTAATLANTATSGTTYTDISSTAPVLVAGSGLYINAGYIGDSYISLAKLIPDSATMPSGASGYSAGLLSGYALYDEDGALVSGSINTYDGTFTIT